MKTLSIAIFSLILFTGMARVQAQRPISELAIEPIPDQVVVAGQKRTLPLSALFEKGANVTLIEAPRFVTLERVADGEAQLRIAPGVDESTGAIVRMRLSLENGFSTETSFRINVLPAFVIERVEYLYPHLSIRGRGFDTAENRVLINGKDCSRYIISQTTEGLVLSGGKRLNLVSGYNRIEVRSGEGEQIFLVAGLGSRQRKGQIGVMLDSVQNIDVEVGRPVTLELKINDESQLTFEFKCDRGNFVTLNGTTLKIDPTVQDLGLTTCLLKVTDSIGLSTSATFFIRVVPCGTPILFNSINDQIIKTGEVRTLEIRVSDPCGLPPVSLSLSVKPDFLTLTDRGDGTGQLRIAPVQGNTGGRVIVDARDSIGILGQMGFNIQVRASAQITTGRYTKPNLSLSGNGFGSGAARISINNQDVSSRIFSQNDTTVVLRGNKKKLNLKSGPNLIQLTPINSSETIEFVLSL
jgi:hypothetical protein